MAGSVDSRASSDCASLTPVKVRIIDGKKGDFDAHLYVGVDVYWVKASSGNRPVDLDSFVTLHREILPTRRGRRGYIQLERGEVVVEDQVAGSKRGAPVARRQIKITSTKQKVSVVFECDDMVASLLLPLLKSRAKLRAALTELRRSSGDNLQKKELSYISDSFIKGLQGVEHAEATPREQCSSKIMEDTPFLLRIATRVCKDVGSLWIPLEKFGKELHHLREPARALTVLPLVGVAFGLIASGLDLCAKVSQDRLDWNQAWKDAILFFETLLDVFCRTLSCEGAMLQRSLDKVAALCEKVEGELRILEKFRFQSTLHKFRNKILDRDSPSKVRDKLKELQQDIQLIFVDRIDQITAQTKKDVKTSDGKIDGQTQTAEEIRSLVAHNSYECSDPTCKHQDCKDENLERLMKKVEVPTLPEHTRLDFENPERPEGKLKDMLLTENSPIVVLWGMGGMGKTTCLIGAARDRGIVDSFVDGVIWIQLSNESGVEKLEEACRNIILFAWHRWGYVVPKCAINRQADLDQLLDYAEDALDGRRCLLIFDDLWYSEKTRKTSCTLAKGIASLSNDSTKIVLSTRFTEIADLTGAKATTVGDLDPETASSLFDAWAEGEPKGMETLALKKSILDLCANVALAVCIAGANVRSIGYEMVLGNLKGNIDNLAQLDHTEGDRNLYGVMKTSLESIKNEGHKNGYQYLAVFANKTKIPSTALEALWGGDEANVEHRVDLYIKMSLATHKTSYKGKQWCYYAEFHDRHLEYARYCCRKPEYDLTEGISLRDTHARLVEGYKKRSRSTGESDAWWKAKSLDDGYFYENYVRHLLDSGAVEDAVELLLDFRWIKLRYERLQMPHLLRDYDVTIERSKRHGKEATTDNNLRVEALRLVSRSLRTALSRLWEHKDELAFQLIGRLRYIRDKNTIIKRLLDQIEGLETGRLLAVNQCFATPSAPQHIFDIDEEVTCLAVMRNEGGWHIVAGISNGDIYIYNGNDMQKSKPLIGRESMVLCLAVTSNASFLISGSWDKTLRIWNILDGKCLRVLRGHEGPVHSVALARDESLAVSGSMDRSVRLWNVATGKCLKVLCGHTNFVNAVSLTANDNRIVSGSGNGELFVWILASGVRERELGKGDDHFGSGIWSKRNLEKDDDDIGSGLSSMAVSSSEDDAFIVTGHSDGAVCIWNIADGRRKYALKGHQGPVTSVAVTPNRQRVVSASWDTMRVWDVANGENLKAFHYFNPYILECMGLIDDNRAVTCSSLGHVRLWDLESLDCDEKNYDDNLRPSVTCSSVSRSGRCIVSGFYDGSVSIRDVDSGEILQTVSGHEEEICFVKIIEEGNLVVSSSYYKTVRVWNLNAEACERVFQSESEGEDVVEVFVAEDQRRIIVAFTNTILVWDVGSKDRSKVCSTPPEEPIVSIAVTDCGNEVVSMSRDWIRLWLVRDGIWCCRLELKGPGERWSSVGITGDGAHVVSASSDNTVRIWNSASGKCEKVLDKHERDVEKLAVTRCGTHVVLLSSSGEVYVWNVADRICNKVSRDWNRRAFPFLFEVSRNCLLMHVTIFSDLLSGCDDEWIGRISKKASAATIKVDDKTLTVAPHDAGEKVMSATFDSKIGNVLVVDFKRGSGRIVLVAGRRLCILKIPDLSCSY